MAENIAKFRFYGYKITDSHIHIDTDKQVSDRCDVTFEKTVGIKEAEHKMRLQLAAKIESENKAMSVEVKAEGYFEFEKDLSDAEKEIFFNTSAPAILFPYVRAYISTLTGLSGIAPIILPTLNLSNR